MAARVEITPSLSIPDSELRFTATRSGGPGGQHVNKVSTRVTILFDLEGSRSLGPEEKSRIRARFARRIGKDGVLRVTCRSFRSQTANRARAIERLAELLREALAVRSPRRKTRASRGAREARLAEKRRRSEVKRGRSGVKS